MASPRKPRPRTTTGNVYTSAPPRPKRKPKYPTYKVKPKLDPRKFTIKKRGGGLGYVAIRKQPPKPKAPAPAPPPVPYADLPEWARPGMLELDREQAAHQGYVSDKVMPWLSTGLANLTGVNPASPGYNPQIQQQYLANVQGQVGGALNAAATATPVSVAPVTPGAISASPTAYESNVMREVSALRGASAIGQAQAQSVLNTTQPNILAQGAMQVMSDYAKGLPQLYATRRAERRAQIDQFMAEQAQQQAELEEEMRHNRVTEATSALNAQTNAAIQFGRLGLSADELALENQPATGEVPVGYVQLPDGRYVRDVTVPAASASSGGTGAAPSAARGQYAPNKLRKEGFVGGWKVKPKNIKGPFVRATDGTWWRKPKGGTGGSSGADTPRLRTTELQEELLDLYKPGDVGGWEERYDNNPRGAGIEIARWVRERKRDFIRGPLGGRVVDVAKLRSVLGRIGGTPAAEALRILTRGYIGSDGRWK